MTSEASDQILWDVVEEHLDEAEYLAETWTTNLHSPAYVLDEFRDGPQERLLAHIDGLVIGGSPVISELLEPVLADEDADPWRAAAAGLTLLAHPSRMMSDRLLQDLDAVPAQPRTGIVTALTMSDRTDLDARVRDAIRRGGSPQTLQVLLQVGGARGIDPQNLLDEILKTGDAPLRAAGLSMLAFGDRRYLSWIEHSIGSPEPEVARAAVRAGLVMGSGTAWQQAGRWGLAEEPDPEAMVWLACFAEPRILERLIARLDDETTRADALWALGFSGRREAAEACLRWLGDAEVGRLAGEAFAAITGLDLEDDTYWDDPIDADPEDEDEPEDQDQDQASGEGDQSEPPELEDDLDEDLSLRPEDELRVPKPEAILRWWKEQGARVMAKQRYVGGRPLDQAGVAHALRTQSLRRRHALAFEMLVRTRGKAYIPTEALTSAQYPKIAALGAMPRVDGNRPFSNIG